MPPREDRDKKCIIAIMLGFRFFESFKQHYGCCPDAILRPVMSMNTDPRTIIDRTKRFSAIKSRINITDDNAVFEIREVLPCPKHLALATRKHKYAIAMSIAAPLSAKLTDAQHRKSANDLYEYRLLPFLPFKHLHDFLEVQAVRDELFRNLKVIISAHAAWGKDVDIGFDAQFLRGMFFLGSKEGIPGDDKIFPKVDWGSEIVNVSKDIDNCIYSQISCEEIVKKLEVLIIRLQPNNWQVENPLTFSLDACNSGLEGVYGQQSRRALIWRFATSLQASNFRNFCVNVDGALGETPLNAWKGCVVHSQSIPPSPEGGRLSRQTPFIERDLTPEAFYEVLTREGEWKHRFRRVLMRPSQPLQYVSREREYEHPGDIESPLRHIPIDLEVSRWSENMVNVCGAAMIRTYQLDKREFHKGYSGRVEEPIMRLMRLFSILIGTPATLEKLHDNAVHAIKMIKESVHNEYVENDHGGDRSLRQKILDFATYLETLGAEKIRELEEQIEKEKHQKSGSKRKKDG